MSLNISRRMGEAITIKHGGEVLTITVVDSTHRRGNAVMLRCDGPHSFVIHRPERNAESPATESPIT